MYIGLTGCFGTESMFLIQLTIMSSAVSRRNLPLNTKRRKESKRGHSPLETWSKKSSIPEKTYSRKNEHHSPRRKRSHQEVVSKEWPTFAWWNACGFRISTIMFLRCYVVEWG